MNRKGTVVFVGKNKYGFWSIKLDQDQYYGCGKEKPECVNGDYVTFKSTSKEVNGKTYHSVVDGSMKVVRESKTEAAPAPTADAPASKPSQSYWDNKDVRIHLLSCRNTAATIVGLALQAGTLKLKAGDKDLAGLAAVVTKLGDDLFRSSFNHNPLSAVEEETAALVNDAEDIEEIDDDSLPE